MESQKDSVEPAGLKPEKNQYGQNRKARRLRDQAAKRAAKKARKGKAHGCGSV